MEKILPNIFVVQTPVFELLASMFRLQSHEQLSKKETLPVPQDFDLDLWVNRVRKQLPDAVKHELEVFFHYETFIGMSMVRFAWQRDSYRSIDEFLLLLRETSPHELFSLFLQTGYVPGVINDIYSHEEVVNFIKNSNVPEVEKWKLSYLYMDILHTKHRFINLVEQCEQLYFAEEWARLAELQIDSATTVMKEIKSRDDITRRFSYMESETVRNPSTTIVISPSVLYHTGSLSSYDESESLLINLYGVYYSELQLGQNELIESFKILADETRIKIIRVLSTGACYGYELAGRLNLSSSTVSHHLSLLSSIGIVSSKRQNNRVYYEVHKEKIAQLMASFTNTLSD